MPKIKLQNQIQKKLDQLLTLLDQIDEVRVINSDEPATWDSDALYNWGEPIVLEEGLCSLVDSYQNETEDYA